MPCYCPIEAWKPLSGGKLVFKEMADCQPLTIPCQRCIGCRLERARQWAMRCVHEAQMHEWSEFVTLTYDDEHIPVDHSLRYSDFQAFMKRLRARYSERQRIRFYMCGEYGDLLGRPHYHACLFGVRFDDRVLFKRSNSGEAVYTSGILSSLWSHGHCATGDVTFESAAYIARYVLKKQFGDVANETSHYRFVDDYGEVHYREAEFNRMSLKPGIGAKWFEKFKSDVFPSDEVVINGRAMKPPRYYDKLLARDDPESAEFLPHERLLEISGRLDDATPARLRVREEVTRAKLLRKRRELE